MTISQKNGYWNSVDLLSLETSELFKPAANTSFWDADSDLCLRARATAPGEKISFRFIPPSTVYQFIEIDLVSLGPTIDLTVVAASETQANTKLGGELAIATLRVTSGVVRTYRFPYVGEIETFIFSGMTVASPVNIKEIRFYTTPDKIIAYPASGLLEPNSAILEQDTGSGFDAKTAENFIYHVAIAPGGTANIRASFTIDGITVSHGVIKILVKQTTHADVTFQITDQSGLVIPYEVTTGYLEIFVTTEWKVVDIVCLNNSSTDIANLCIELELFNKVFPISAFGFQTGTLTVPLAALAESGFCEGPSSGEGGGPITPPGGGGGPLKSAILSTDLPDQVLQIAHLDVPFTGTMTITKGTKATPATWEIHFDGEDGSGVWTAGYGVGTKADVIFVPHHVGVFPMTGSVDHGDIVPTPLYITVTDETPPEELTWKPRVLWFPDDQVVKYSFADGLTTRVIDAALLGDGSTVFYDGCYTPDNSPIYNFIDDRMYFTSLKYLSNADYLAHTNPHHMLIRYDPWNLVIEQEVELPGGTNKIGDNTTLRMLDCTDNRIWLSAFATGDTTIPRRISTYTRPVNSLGGANAVGVVQSGDDEVTFGVLNWASGTGAPVHHDIVKKKIDGTAISITTLDIPNFNGQPVFSALQCQNIPEVSGIIWSSSGGGDFGEWYVNNVLQPDYPIGDGIGTRGVDGQIITTNCVAIGSIVYTTGLSGDLGYFIGKWAIGANAPVATYSLAFNDYVLSPSETGHLYIHRTGSSGSLIELDGDLGLVHDFGISAPIGTAASFIVWNNIICWQTIGGTGAFSATAYKIEADHSFTFLGSCPVASAQRFISLGNGLVSIGDGIISLIPASGTATVKAFDTTSLLQVFGIVEPAATYEEWGCAQSASSGKILTRHPTDASKLRFKTVTSPTTYTFVDLTFSTDGGDSKPLLALEGSQRNAWLASPNWMVVPHEGGGGTDGILASFINLNTLEIVYLHTPGATDYGPVNYPFYDYKTQTVHVEAQEGTWQGSLEILPYTTPPSIIAKHGGDSGDITTSYTHGSHVIGRTIFMFTLAKRVGEFDSFYNDSEAVNVVPVAIYNTDTFTSVSGHTWPMTNYTMAYRKFGQHDVEPNA